MQKNLKIIKIFLLSFLLLAIFVSARFLLVSGKFDIKRYFFASLTSYDSDPDGLADGEHVLFIDQNNPNCSDSYTRSQVLNPDTPWCSNAVFTVWGSTSPVEPGDTVLFKSGTYYGRIYVGHTQATEGNGVTFQNYPGDTVNLFFAKKFTDWTDLGDGFYEKNIDEMDTGTLQLQAVYLRAWVENGEGVAGITKVNTLNDLYDPPVGTGLDAGDYNFMYVDTETKDVYLRLVGSSPENIYLGSSRFEIDDDSPYTTVKGFNIFYAYDGLKSYSNHTTILNNTIKYTGGEGILSSTDYLDIEGNTITNLGTPLHYYSGTTTLVTYGSQAHAMYLGGNYGLVKNNYMSDCAGQCMHPWQQNPPYPTNFTISNNIIKGDFVTNGSDIDVYNNLIYGSVWIYDSVSTDVRVYNNYIELQTGDLNYFVASSSFTFSNNIIFGDNGYCNEIGNIDFSNSQMSHNIYYDCDYWYLWKDSDYARYYNFSDYQSAIKDYNSSLESDSIFSDPLVVEDSSLSSSSPAIDTGSCMIYVDYYGYSRPSGNGCDIGPFEYRSEYCGDGSCNGTETCSTCSSDCGSCKKSAAGGGSSSYEALSSEETPTNLVATASVLGQISLSWSLLESSDISSYVIYRCKGLCSNPSVKIGATSSTNYIDSTVSAGTTYTYAVSALSYSGVYSSMSNTAKVTSKGSLSQSSTISSTSSVQQDQQTQNQTFHAFTKPLYLTIKDSEVSTLQSFLAKDKTIYPKGLVTGYYGALTYNAVGAFQIKYGIVTSIYSKGYGMVGPKTRAKLNELAESQK